jgi:hypothetical protein
MKNHVFHVLYTLRNSVKFYPQNAGNRISETQDFKIPCMGVHAPVPLHPSQFHYLGVATVKVDGQEGGFQAGGYFSRSLKRERMNNHALITIRTSLLVLS